MIAGAVVMAVLSLDATAVLWGPHSLGEHGRFVVDHAQCRVVIVWPQTAPPASTIPPLPKDDPRR